MKNIIIVLFFLSLIFIVTEEDIVIPKESIRFRIIANSNSMIDQKIKMDIKKDIQLYFNELLKNNNNIEEVRDLIKDNIDEINNIVKKYNVDYNISYGDNYFPKKEYKGITYEDGNYESLVINIGQSKGDNWWCVLYPPLCLVEDNNFDEKEYKSYIYELINNYK